MSQKFLFKLCRTAVAVLPFVLGAAATHAAPLTGSTISPLVSAGAPPDSPAGRVDPNLPTSPFSGVVSINIRYNGLSFICSGTLVSKRHVVTAGHCVDTDGNGTLIDINQAGNDVRVVFNSEPNPGDPGRAIITADQVSMHPDYQGFGNCPSGVPGFCVNDDVAVIHMNQDAPDTAQIYRVANPDTLAGLLMTMVGYGTTGDGINGYTQGPNFRIKRAGQNIWDLFDLDDEQGFAGGAQEVWYSDFDGNGRDLFCELGIVCSQQLGNTSETNIGGGDSGGPSFIKLGNEYLLLGNNTFGGNFPDTADGAFGSFFGGMALNNYLPYLLAATNGQLQVVPEPGSFALLGIGFAGMLAARRRRTQA